MTLDRLPAATLAVCTRIPATTRFPVPETSLAVTNEPPTTLSKEDLSALLPVMTQGENKVRLIRLLPREHMRALVALLDKGQLIQALAWFPRERLWAFLVQASQTAPRLRQALPPGEAGLSQPQLLGLFWVLPESRILTLVAQLPDPVLAQAAAQVDDDVFATWMIRQQMPLLCQLATPV